MFRKFAIALAATIAIGGAAVSVGATPAAAFGHGGGHGGHGGGWHGGSHGWHGGSYGGWRGHRGYGFYGAPVYAYGGGCMVRRWVDTPWGPRARLINRCY